MSGEVGPAWLRYELPKLGIAGSNPALRTYFTLEIDYLLTILLTYDLFTNSFVDKRPKMLTSARKLLTKKLKLSMTFQKYE